jgi:hypothetical protein
MDLVSMRPVCATAESRNGKVTLTGDMDKMHLVLSLTTSSYSSDKITKKAVFDQV